MKKLYVNLKVDPNKNDGISISLISQDKNEKLKVLQLSRDQCDELFAFLSGKPDTPIRFDIPEIDMLTFLFKPCGESSVCPCEKWRSDGLPCIGVAELNLFTLTPKLHLRGTIPLEAFLKNLSPKKE